MSTRVAARPAELTAQTGGAVSTGIAARPGRQ